MEKRKGIPDPDEIAAAVLSASNGTVPTSAGKNVIFFSQAYTAASIRALRGCQLTPELIATVARLHLMFYTEHRSAVILIGRNKKIKGIEPLTRKYRATYEEMSNLLVRACIKAKAHRCAVIYNYPYKLSRYYRIRDADKLFRKCKENKILLADIVEFSEGITESVLLPICWNGIDQTL